MSQKNWNKNTAKIEDHDALMDEFDYESDRGYALMAVAALDIVLAGLLSSFMIDEPNEVNDLLGTSDNPDAPLGTFSARILAAYCLGLLTKRMRQNLHLMRRIRNHFAHQLHGGSFEEEPVKSWCDALQVSDLPEDGHFVNYRHKFTYAYIDLHYDMKYLRHPIIEPRRKVLTDDDL